MKMFRLFLVSALLGNLAAFAHAGSIHAVIVDPPITPNIYELDPGDTSIPSADFNFGVCTPGELNELAGTGATAGCFEIENFTGVAITGFSINFIGDPSVFGTAPTCGGQFAFTSCTESNGVYSLLFSDGSIPDGSDAIIGESLPISDFNDVSVNTAVSLAPEPNSLVLLGTGVFAAMGFAYQRRRSAVWSAPRI